MLFLHLFKIMSVKGTVLVDTFMDAEELPVLFWNQGMAAVRTEETDGGSEIGPARKSLSADLALVLSAASIIVIDVVMRRATEGTEDIFGNGTAIAAPDGSDGLSILPLVVFEKELPVLPNERLDDREFVHFKFLVFRRMGIVIGPLF